MIPAWIAFLDGLLALSAVGAGIVGAHIGWFAPFMGFQVFALGLLIALFALILGVIGVFTTRRPDRALGRPRAIVGLVLGLLIILPALVIVLGARKYPAINDITTNIDQPPEFTNATKLPQNQKRDMTYNAKKYADKQRSGYGDVTPFKMAASPEAAFKVVEAAAKSMPNWQITMDDPGTRTIEGVATSALFRFQDDFVIQVRPGEGGTSLVEMRSKSRDGIGDQGVNYNRIMTFFKHLSAAPA